MTDEPTPGALDAPDEETPGEQPEEAADGQATHDLETEPQEGLLVVDRSMARNAAALLLPALLAGGIDVLQLSHAPSHGALLFVVVGLTGASLWRMIPRWELILAGCVPLAAWPLVYATSTVGLAITALVGALLLAPPSLLDHAPRIIPANVAGVVAGGATLALTGDPTGGIVAGIVAGVGAGLRPLAPTQGTLAAVRSGALYAPGAALAGLLLLNAATGRFDELEVKAALGFALAVTALLLMVSLAALGLATLLESRTPMQHAAWGGMALLLGLVAGSLVLRDPSGTLALVPVAAAPLGLLLPVLPARLTLGEGPLREVAGLSIPTVLAVVQWAL